MTGGGLRIVIQQPAFFPSGKVTPWHPEAYTRWLHDLYYSSIIIYIQVYGRSQRMINNQRAIRGSERKPLHRIRMFSIRSISLPEVDRIVHASVLSICIIPYHLDLTYASTHRHAALVGILKHA